MIRWLTPAAKTLVASLLRAQTTEILQTGSLTLQRSMGFLLMIKAQTWDLTTKMLSLVSMLLLIRTCVISKSVTLRIQWVVWRSDNVRWFSTSVACLVLKPTSKPLIKIKMSNRLVSQPTLPASRHSRYKCLNRNSKESNRLSNAFLLRLVTT